MAPGRPLLQPNASSASARWRRQSIRNPTQAEAIKKVGDAYNRTRLTPFVKGLFQKWLAWMR